MRVFSRSTDTDVANSEAALRSGYPVEAPKYPLNPLSLVEIDKLIKYLAAFWLTETT